MALVCRFSQTKRMSKVGQVYITLSKAVQTTSFAYAAYNLSRRIITMFSICPNSIIIIVIMLWLWWWLDIRFAYKKRTLKSDKDLH